MRMRIADQTSLFRARPFPGSLDGLLPTPVQRFSLIGAKARFKRSLDLPASRDLFRRLPEANGQPGQVRCAQRRRLGDGRTLHWHAEDIGLELHKPVVGSRAAIDSQRIELE